METSKTQICEHFLSELEDAVGNHASEDIFILTDENTQLHCLPRLKESVKLNNSHVIVIKSGDNNKNIDTVAEVWTYLAQNGATRKSLMINVGGGMVTDLGGFAASTFKRGMNFINVSTTLLGAVDAATGGKTGVNFLGYKNEIGLFALPKDVLIDVNFFRSLDDKNIRSGYAEMVKHALIDSEEEWKSILRFDLDNIDFEQLKTMLRKSIEVKERIVRQDPKEENIRKALNFGHTFGHAFESLSFKIGNPQPHGYAIMWGMLCELYLSHIKLDFPKETILQFRQLMLEYYGTFNFNCKQYEDLLELMQHDKKNESKQINFTLLDDVGKICINQTATKDEILECLDYLREG